MKITIIDKDFYFAKKLLVKFNKNGYQPKYFSSLTTAMENDQADIYLLSSDFYYEERIEFVERFKDKNIILLANYYSNDTVRNFLDLGANDYVIKPFRFEELEQKIDYFKLNTSLNTYQSYIKYFLENIDMKSTIFEKFEPPLIILTNYTIYIDKLIMEYSQNKNQIFSFISLTSKDWKSKIRESNFSDFIYISNAQTLNNYDRAELLQLIQNKKFIISTTKPIQTKYKVLELNSDEDLYDANNIMSIEKYIQFIIKNFQYKITDTELAKRLEFSRKSLYARRSKYNIYKKERKIS